MQKPSFDPGLTQQFNGILRRTINKDGSFNVSRRGGSWKHIHPYLHLINMGWAPFLGTVFLLYVAVNTMFALAYFALGPGQIHGMDGPTASGRFLTAFFFSAQTLTTVGYGNFAPRGTAANFLAAFEALVGLMGFALATGLLFGRFLTAFFFSAQTLTTVGYGNFAPRGTAANFLAAFEALVGLMGFALATGLLFGRFSKPSAKIGFSDRMLVSHYQEHTSLQFRVVNLRSNILLEIETSVMLMTVEGSPGQLRRRYQTLTLERDRIYFFPLTWTVVHPIDETSPLFGKTPEELARLQAEILILIKGFDDTFSQTVNARNSYRYDEIVWGGRFSPAFQVDGTGQLVLNVDEVGKFSMGEPIAG